jgi:hypothetical protein
MYQSNRQTDEEKAKKPNMDKHSSRQTDKTNKQKNNEKCFKCGIFN